MNGAQHTRAETCIHHLTAENAFRINGENNSVPQRKSGLTLARCGIRRRDMHSLRAGQRASPLVYHLSPLRVRKGVKNQTPIRLPAAIRPYTGAMKSAATSLCESKPYPERACCCRQAWRAQRVGFLHFKCRGLSRTTTSCAMENAGERRRGTPTPIFAEQNKLFGSSPALRGRNQAHRFLPRAAGEGIMQAKHARACSQSTVEGAPPQIFEGSKGNSASSAGQAFGGPRGGVVDWRKTSRGGGASAEHEM